jgi:adenylate cyclase
LGSAQGTEQIARQLQVRYALQGDVRFIADRIRISTKFHDAEASKLLWEETFEGKLDDIFSIQDSLIDKTLDALLDRSKDQISGVQQTQRANNIEAYDRYLYGRKYFYLYASKIDNNKARELFLKAIEYDPNFANAYAMLAWTHVYEAMNGWSEDREASLERAYVLSEQAIQIQPALPLAYFVRGLVNRERKEYIKAIVDVEKALQYDPNYANAHMLMGTLLYYAGQPEESIQTIRKAMRLNPHHPYNYSFHLGQGLYILRRYQEAIEALESGLETNPSSLRTQVWLVAALAQSGDTDEAAWQVELLLLENPDLSLQKIQHLFPFKDTKDLDHFLEGLRIAGLSQTLLIE